MTTKHSCSTHGAGVRNESGAVMLEFALTSMLFLSLIVVTLESAVAGFRALTIQYIASAAVRQGALSQAPLDNVPALKTHIVELGQSLGVTIDPDRIEICGGDDLNDDGLCGGVLNMGVPERFLAVQVETTTPYFLGMMEINLLGQALSRNERR